MSISRMRGLTLIELIVFIIIVSVALTGIVTVYTTVIRNSVDPLRQKQAFAAGESMLEEIMNKNFCDPDTEVLPAAGVSSPATCGVHTTEATRAEYDDVTDYDGYNSNSGGLCAAGGIGIKELVTPASVVLANYDLSVAVAVPAANFAPVADAVTPTNHRIVTVTVRDCQTNNSYTLTGYKFNND